MQYMFTYLNKRMDLETAPLLTVHIETLVEKIEDDVLYINLQCPFTGII